MKLPGAQVVQGVHATALLPALNCPAGQLMQLRLAVVLPSIAMNWPAPQGVQGVHATMLSPVL